MFWQECCRYNTTQISLHCSSISLIKQEICQKIDKNSTRNPTIPQDIFQLSLSIIYFHHQFVLHYPTSLCSSCLFFVLHKNFFVLYKETCVFLQFDCLFTCILNKDDKYHKTTIHFVLTRKFVVSFCDSANQQQWAQCSSCHNICTHISIDYTWIFFIQSGFIFMPFIFRSYQWCSSVHFLIIPFSKLCFIKTPSSSPISLTKHHQSLSTITLSSHHPLFQICCSIWADHFSINLLLSWYRILYVSMISYLHISADSPQIQE